MNVSNPKSYPRRIYPLDARNLTEEQIAVTFAMTSRRPEPFDEIAQQVSQEKAADFHERWVLGYGHASVAEHAVVHLAAENISRLACDTLEDNRLASYTEKSSRYQVMDQDYFYTPRELEKAPGLEKLHTDTCRRLFQTYYRLIDGCLERLKQEHPQRERERDSAYHLRLRRIATDSCRAVLPAATLTNVGVTANARILEHAISKLLSSELAEEKELGEELREQGRKITPTLIKYANENDYLSGTARRQRKLWGDLGLRSGEKSSQSPFEKGGQEEISGPGQEGEPRVRLVEWDPQAEEKLATALLYRHSDLSYEQVRRRVQDMTDEERRGIIHACAEKLGPHDAPVREFEMVGYTFEFVMDYGAYREFKRHRMQSYIPQPLSVAVGYYTPQLITDSGMAGEFQEAVRQAEEAYNQVWQLSPAVAQYLVTHAHYRRVLSRMNLRECYHLFKLRTSKEAHETIREPVKEAMKLAVETQPELFRHLKLRDEPEWWRFKAK